MNNSILDTKFKHHSWFKRSALTKRQAIEHFASCDDFYLSEKSVKEQSNNLFDPIKYEPILVYGGKSKSSYKLTKEEKEYYIQRKIFWEKYKQEIWNKWDKSKSYLEWLDYEREQNMAIPEYFDYMKAYQS